MNSYAGNSTPSARSYPFVNRNALQDFGDAVYFGRLDPPLPGAVWVEPACKSLKLLDVKLLA